MSSDTPLTLEDRLAPAPDVLIREIDGEAVLVNLESALYFGLDETGTRIWAWLVEQGRLGAVLDRLLETYEVERDEAEGDLLRLAGELLDQGLVVRDSR